MYRGFRTVKGVLMGLRPGLNPAPVIPGCALGHGPSKVGFFRAAESSGQILTPQKPLQASRPAGPFRPSLRCPEGSHN